MIELDEFSMSRNDYYRLIFRHSLKKLCWVYAYVAVILTALMIPFGNWGFLLIVLMGTLIVYSILFFIQCRNTLPSVKETHLFQKRKISFGDDKFHIQCEDGSESHVLLNHVIKADRMGDYYRLFLNKLNFCPILVSAFRSEEDRIRFETEILGVKLKANAVPWKAIFIFLLISACLLGSMYVMSRL